MDQQKAIPRGPRAWQRQETPGDYLARSRPPPRDRSRTGCGKHFIHGNLPDRTSAKSQDPSKKNEGAHGKGCRAACDRRDHLIRDCPASLRFQAKGSIRERKTARNHVKDSRSSNNSPINNRNDSKSMSRHKHPEREKTKHETNLKADGYNGLGKRPRSRSPSPATSFLNQLGPDHNMSPISKRRRLNMSPEPGPVSEPVEVIFGISDHPPSIGNPQSSSTLQQTSMGRYQSPRNERMIKQEPQEGNVARNEDLNMVDAKEEPQTQQNEIDDGLEIRRKLKEQKREKNLQHLRKLIEQEKELHKLRTQMTAVALTAPEQTGFSCFGSADESKKSNCSETVSVPDGHISSSINDTMIDHTQSSTATPTESQPQLSDQEKLRSEHQKLCSELLDLELEPLASSGKTSLKKEECVPILDYVHPQDSIPLQKQRPSTPQQQLGSQQLSQKQPLTINQKQPITQQPKTPHQQHPPPQTPNFPTQQQHNLHLQPTPNFHQQFNSVHDSLVANNLIPQQQQQFTFQPQFPYPQTFPAHPQFPYHPQPQHFPPHNQPHHPQPQSNPFLAAQAWNSKLTWILRQQDRWAYQAPYIVPPTLPPLPLSPLSPLFPLSPPPFPQQTPNLLQTPNPLQTPIPLQNSNLSQGTSSPPCASIYSQRPVRKASHSTKEDVQGYTVARLPFSPPPPPPMGVVKSEYENSEGNDAEGKYAEDADGKSEGKDEGKGI